MATSFPDPSGVLRTFDWLPRFDERSRAWGVAGLLAAQPTAYDRLQNARVKALTARVAALEGKPTPPVPPVPPAPNAAVLWDCPTVLDQAQTGMCVGYGWTDLVQSSPKPEAIIAGTGDQEGSTPDTLYDLAQKNDGSPADPQSGASVLGGAKGAQSLGEIVAYHWAFSVTDVAQAVLRLGPVVLGIPWTDGMMDPDAQGQIHPTGATVGGHCILDRGYDPAWGLHRLRNSWGDAWGLSGDCLISDADLTGLLAQSGEACVASKP